MNLQLIFVIWVAYLQVFQYEEAFFVWTFVLFIISWITNIFTSIRIKQYLKTFVAHIKTTTK